MAMICSCQGLVRFQKHFKVKTECRRALEGLPRVLLPLLRGHGAWGCSAPLGQGELGVSKAHPDEPMWFSSESKARQRSSGEGWAYNPSPSRPGAVSDMHNTWLQAGEEQSFGASPALQGTLSSGKTAGKHQGLGEQFFSCHSASPWVVSITSCSTEGHQA